ncbi:ABC transporter permease [Streptomyces sp. NPDC051211]|uniref:ABC transporter permease n=1 Tax=Streptomyces sp. NPDC051211 TaxID=3154643 RepID=UPI00344EE64E
MSAVWRASRGAVKRRRVQTVVIGLVVLCSTLTVLLALTLLGAASAPFERMYAKQRGAHAVATYDAAKVSGAQLADTARRPGIQAAAGPFGQTVLQTPKGWLWMPGGPLAVVGRADPAGPVDRIELLEGRWATAPGEIVVNWSVQGTPNPELLGTQLPAAGAAPLTVVGFAVSASHSAGAWVTPDQMAALHPAALQMLYRFTDAGTDRQVEAGLAEATAGLPEGALTTSQSHLALKRAFSEQADAYLPFISVFGILGLLVSVLIVGNVISGAVVSGYRHIGVLKALGFTPNQVVAVYLTMVFVPAAVGSVLGTLAGALLAEPVLQMAFSGVETGQASIGLSPWIPVGCLLGMPALVLVTALIPALRAHRLSAARAISAGSSPRAGGRGLGVQRRLSGSPLPRSVSLGLGQPFARPGRTLMTMAAIVLGVTTVTVTTGLTGTMLALGKGGEGEGPRVQVAVDLAANDDRTTPALDDAEIEKRLRSLPGAQGVTARALTRVGIVGHTETRFVDFYRGENPPDAERVVEGRYVRGPGEAVAGPPFLTRHGLKVGDRITLELGGRRAEVTIVGQLMSGNQRALTASWDTMAALDPEVRPAEYRVQLEPGTDAKAYSDAVRAAGPGLHASPLGDSNSVTATIIGFSSVFTVLLSAVAALGVFNTVLLNTRERRRDLGMLKSIGMTPRQVVAMTVASVAAVGAVGGLLGIPIGMAAHRLLVDHVGVVRFPESMKDVWQVPQLAGLALAGVAIAVLGALIPARSAARLTIAKVLHNE